jgi:hypothetical protein
MHRLAAAFALLAAGCDQSCTLVGCTSGARFTFDPVIEQAVMGARFELCMNTTCREITVPTLPTVGEIGRHEIGSLSETTMTVWLERANPGISMAVSFEGADEEKFRDGDVYSIAVVSPDGSELVRKLWSVTYTSFEPNGEDCGPTCRSAATKTEL